MSYDIAPNSVIAVLNEVNPVLEGYEELFTTFGEQLGTLTTACKAEPVGAELESLTIEVLQPAMSNIAGRTSNAVSAVNQVVTLLTSADTTMSDEARQAAVRSEQLKADDAPAPIPAE